MRATHSPTVRARLTDAVTSAEGRRSYRRVVLEDGPDGPTAAPVSRQASHQLSALAQINALAVVPEHLTGLPAGAEVDVVRLP